MFNIHFYVNTKSECLLLIFLDILKGGNNLNKISTKHLIFLFLSVTSVSLRSYSSIFIKIGGRDTWVAAIIAVILFSLYTLFIVYVTKKTNSLDFKEVFLNTYPKPIGNILVFLFAICLFITAVESASAESNAIHTNIFIETPVWYCLIFFIVPGCYILTRKFKSILTVILLTVVAVKINNIFLELLIWKYRDTNNLLPVIANSTYQTFITVTLLLLGSLASIAIIFPFFKFLKNTNHLVKHTGLSILIIAIVVINSLISTISIFGPNRAENIFYPEFIQSQVVQLYGFIEFGNFLFLFRIVCYWFIKYVICGTAILFLYKEKIKNKKIFAIFFSIATFIASYFLSKNQYYLFDALTYYQLLILIVFLVIPFTTYFAYFLKNRRIP